MKVRLFSLLVITLAMLGMMAVLAGTASADGGAHRGSTSVVQDCSRCHRAHTAVGSNLLKATSAYELCTSCHGAGADLDVINGKDNADGAPTRGSGFAYSWMNTTLTTTVPVTYTKVTSKHWVQGDPIFNSSSITQTTVWGLGAMGTATGAGTTFVMQCSTCHDPHGKSGPGGAATYRILRSDLSVAGPVGATGYFVPDTISHTYSINNANMATYPNAYYGQQYSSVNDETGTDNDNMTALNAWCAGCHTRIHTSDNTGTGTSGPGKTASADGIFTYRHVTTGKNIDLNWGTANQPDLTSAADAPGCMTCHVSHGSPGGPPSSNSAKRVAWPGGAEGSSPSAPYTDWQDSALLRLSSRGVCEACHNK